MIDSNVPACAVCGGKLGEHFIDKHPEMQAEWVASGVRHIQRLLRETIPHELAQVRESLAIAENWLASVEKYLPSKSKGS